MRTEAVERNPEFRVAARRERKRTGHDTNNRVGPVAQLHRLPHGIAPCAEAMKPCPIAQDHDIGSAGTVLSGMEVPPQHGMRTQGLKKAAAHTLAPNRLCTGPSAQKIAAAAVNIERTEGFVQPLPVKIIRIGEGPAWRFNAAFVHRHQPTGI